MSCSPRVEGRRNLLASLDGLNLKRVQPKSKQSPDNPRPKPIQKPRVNEEVPSRAEVSDRIVPEAARDQISLRFLLAQGRVAELLIPADITDKERKRLLRHLEIDLSEEISDL